MVWKRVVRAAVKGAAAVAVVMASRGASVAQTPPKHDTFSARTMNLAVGAGQDVKADVFRWSTDPERQTLLAALKEKPEAFAEALQKGPPLGTIWTEESIGYTIRYAYRDMLAAGGERVILVTDRPLGSWSGQTWKPLHASQALEYPFSLIELRFGRSGAGEGKLSLTNKVVADETAKTIALADYDSGPVLFRSAKRESASSR